MSTPSPQARTAAAPDASRPASVVFADWLDSLVLRVSQTAAGLFLLLTAAIVAHVGLRYAVGINLVWLEELHWQLYAFLATLGVAAAAATDSHVRLDLLHPRFSPRTKALIEVVGQGLFVLPLTGLIGWHGWRAVTQAFAIGEQSVNEQGLPFTFIVKAALPLACGLIGLTAVARLLRAVAQLGQPSPRDPVRQSDRRRSRPIVVIAGLVLVTGVLAAAAALGRVEPSYALVVVMFASFMLVLFSGFPIAFVLGGIAVVFIGVGYAADFVGYTLNATHPGTKLYLGTAAGFVNRIYGGLLTKPELVALPMFIFMGLLLDRSGMAKQMMQAMQRLFGRVRGGLAISVVLIGILLAASTGIIGASVVLLGLISLPVMLGQGYARPLAAGSVCAAGTLGILMPPSIMLVIMADQASVPVGDLFMGAVLPGIILAGLYLVYLLAVGLLAPAQAPLVSAEPLSATVVVDLAKAILPALALIVVVLGSIFAGVATVTEASGIGAVGASLLAVGHWLRASGNDQHRLSITTLAKEGWQTCFDAFQITGSIVGILIGATCFAFILRELGGDGLIRLGLESLPFGPYGVIGTILVVIFLLGFFLDWIEITIIVLPLVVGTVGQLDFGFVAPVNFQRPEDFATARATANTIWFCILMAVCLQTSFLTPPVGFALFYLKGVAPPEVTLLDLYRGVVPFVCLQLLGLLLVLLLGGPLVLWLPRLVYGW